MTGLPEEVVEVPVLHLLLYLLYLLLRLLLLRLLLRLLSRLLAVLLSYPLLYGRIGDHGRQPHLLLQLELLLLLLVALSWRLDGSGVVPAGPEAGRHNVDVLAGAGLVRLAGSLGAVPGAVVSWQQISALSVVSAELIHIVVMIERLLRLLLLRWRRRKLVRLVLGPTFDLDVVAVSR